MHPTHQSDFIVQVCLDCSQDPCKNQDSLEGAMYVGFIKPHPLSDGAHGRTLSQDF